MRTRFKIFLVILSILILLALIVFTYTKFQKQSLSEDEERAEAEIIALEEGKQIDDNFNIVGNAIQTYTHNLRHISCSDSDGGKNYDEYGEATLKYSYKRKKYSYKRKQTSRTFKDRCLNNRLLEYYCKNNHLALAVHMCPNWCEGGKCNSEELNNCSIESYPEFNNLISQYCPSSELQISKPSCDYGEVINGICLMGTNQTRTKDFGDFKVTLNYNSRIGDTNTDHLIFSIEIENKGSMPLRINRGLGGNAANEGDITISGILTNTQSCSVLDNIDKPDEGDLCYVTSNFPDLAPPHSSVIWTREIRGVKNSPFEMVGNDKLKILQKINGENKIIGELYSVLFYSAEWEEACPGVLVPRSQGLGDLATEDIPLKDTGICCNNIFFFGAGYCNKQNQIKSEAENMVINSGYPEKTSFGDASAMLQSKLESLPNLYKGRLIPQWTGRKAVGEYDYAVLPTVFDVPNGFLERASIWIEEQSIAYGMGNDFSINFIALNQNVDTSDITSTNVQEIARQILLKYLNQGTNLNEYDGFMVLVDNHIMIELLGLGPIGGEGNIVVEIDGQEYIVNFVAGEGINSEEKSLTTFVHELFHDFGTMDLYKGGAYLSDNLLFYPCLMGERNSGTNIESINLCEISASYIGWLDLNDNGRKDVFE